MRTAQLRKYPRTRHLEGSRPSSDDEDLEVVAFDELAGRYLVVQEKVDGANAGISFAEGGELLLQSRGHFLAGGPRERHFALFKSWAQRHRQSLEAALGRRHVLYGEWLYAKHTVFYDALPHYFLELDVLDRETDAFLSTERRRALLAGVPLASAPSLWRGLATRQEQLAGLIGPSRLKSARWREALRETCAREGLDAERVLSETDQSDAMEGIYVRVEEEGEVAARCKLVRPDFATTLSRSGSHWLDRPIVPNALRPGVDIFAERL